MFNHFSQTLKKHKELDSNFGQMLEKCNKLVILFEQSIEKLKTIEIHPKMQAPSQKYLIDIYFDESKMNEWKERCVSKSRVLNKKINSKASIVAEERVRIRNEKTTNIAVIKTEYWIILFI